MLIRRRDLDEIVAGRIDLAFRFWKRPTVKLGGTLMTAVGLLSIDELERVTPAEITGRDAKRAGFGTKAELLEQLRGRTGELYRIRLSWVGEDLRVQLRQRDRLSDREREEIRARLARFDAASRRGPWTARTLALIDEHPAVLAADLAERAAWEKAWLKTNVRKLKNLGLTESLELGYRLSACGRAFLGHDPLRP